MIDKIRFLPDTRAPRPDTLFLYPFPPLRDEVHRLDGGQRVDVRRGDLAQHEAPASDATVRRQLKAGDWVYKRFAKTVPRNAPSAAKKKPGWQRLSPPSASVKPNDQ